MLIKQNPKKYNRLKRFSGTIGELVKYAKQENLWESWDCYVCAKETPYKELRMVYIPDNHDFVPENVCEDCYLKINK